MPRFSKRAPVAATLLLMLTTSTTVVADDSRTASSVQETTGLVLSLVGLLSVGSGVSFMALSGGAWADANGGSASRHDEAIAYTTVSVISFIAGAVLLPTGIALFLTSPTQRVHVALAPSGLGAVARVTF